MASLVVSLLVRRLHKLLKACNCCMD
jgi:hypothetical protein